MENPDQILGVASPIQSRPTSRASRASTRASSRASSKSKSPPRPQTPTRPRPISEPKGAPRMEAWMKNTAYVQHRGAEALQKVVPEQERQLNRILRTSKKVGGEEFIRGAIDDLQARSVNAVNLGLRAFHILPPTTRPIFFQQYPGNPESAQDQAKYFLKSFKRFDRKSKELLPYLQAVQRAADHYKLSHEDVVSIITVQLAEDCLQMFSNALTKYDLNAAVHHLLQRFGHLLSPVDYKHMFQAYRITLKNAEESAYLLLDWALAGYPLKTAGELESMVINKINDTLPNEISSELFDFEEKLESLKRNDPTIPGLEFSEYVAKLRSIIDRKKPAQTLLNQVVELNRNLDSNPI